MYNATNIFTTILFSCRADDVDEKWNGLTVVTIFDVSAVKLFYQAIELASSVH